MSSKIIWKLVLSALIVAWSVTSFLPFNDIDFGDYLAKEVSAEEEAFNALLDEANQLKVEENNDVHSIYVALRKLSTERALDIAAFFPHVNLQDIKNQEKRNEILLKHLYSQSKGKLKRGLDLQGGVAFTLQMNETALADKEAYEKEEQLSKAIDIMANRVDGLGVSEPIIRAVGSDRIEIQMPGLDSRQNPDVIDAVKKPAKLEFKLVHRFATPSLQPGADTPPPGYVAMTEERVDPRTGETYEVPYYVKRVTEATGDILERAYPAANETGGYESRMNFTPKGGKRFADLTGEIAEENNQIASQTGQPSIGQLAIVLDGKLYSAPSVRERLGGGSAVITGDFSQRDAIELANVLNNPLAVELEVAEMYEVGPSLAADARSASINAAMIGGALVIVFMIAYYWLGGIAAVISVVCNVVIVVGILASLQATMTLPGVAALVLTIGMAVDANILIFERIREELKAGKSTPAALSGGYEKALSTIVDANVTTMITAVILIWLGTGPVKGFGVTLAIGIGASMFCALVVSRLVLDVLVEGLKVKKILGLSIMGASNIDFLKLRVPAFAFSWTVVLIGVGWLVTHHDHIFGIDFVGGDELTVNYEETVSMSEFQEVAQQGNFGEVNAIYQNMIGEAKSVIKVQTELGVGEEFFEALVTTFPDRNLELVGANQIGASVSGEIQKKAIMSVLVALVGILLYVAVRFEVGYGIGAVVATVHDVLMTLGIFVLFGGQFTAPMIAAVLMILGYSINDTIVVFDRIREELSLNPEKSLKDIIRMAINRVLSRSILTSVTTFIAALVLWIFGAGVINDFAFVFMIGIITGTFSSIFIASPIFYWWHKGDRKHVEERDLLPKYDWQASSKGAEE
ncbi:MAG: protein translocase subunit SecD [Opitutales bacterium]|nr:protein translocase subunit SecD [Opitutales bacterium]